MTRDSIDAPPLIESRYSTELRRALKDEDLQEILQGDVGVFSLRYLFINEYINYITFLKTNPTYRPTVDPAKSPNSGNMLDLIKRIMGGKKGKQVDFIFVSRNRQVKAKVKSGYIEGDYIFYSVIDELTRRHPECKHQMYIIDDSYDKYNYLTLQDVISSLNIAFKSFLKWNLFKKRIIKRLEASDCSHAMTMASYFFHPRIFLRTALMGYSMANMLSMMSPKVIVSNDDCMYTKPLNSDGKMVILQSARMANYLEECKEFIFQERRLKPDFFLSSGQIFANMKERYNEAKKVLITGLPRNDVLGNASEIYSKSEFLKTHNIDPNDKIVLWTTQCHASSEKENNANYQAIFGVMKELQSITLIIKQHPAEGEIYTEIMGRYMEDYKINGFIAPKDSDTYELLFICDLVIAKASTTAMEATALNKPVIILNLSEISDPVEYVREGVALGVYSKEDLKGGILRLLADDSELSMNRPKYVENYLYKMDGLATDRVVGLLTKLAKMNN